MAHTDPFLLGPLGRMHPLPGVPVGDGVDVPEVQVGGTATSVRGRPTTDVWATHRTYSFRWPLARTPEAEALLIRSRRLYRGADESLVLRLLDPGVPNLLTLDESVCGAETRIPAASTTGAVDPVSWATVVGGVSSLVAVGLDVPDPLVGYADVVAQWAGSQCVAAYLAQRRIPVLGRAVTFSAYVRGAGTLQAVISSGTPTVGPLTALTGAWQRVTASLPAGTTGESAFCGLLPGAVGTTVQTTGWQAEHGITATPWTPGGGCPEVEITGFTDGYRALGRRAVEMTLTEVV